VHAKTPEQTIRGARNSNADTTSEVRSRGTAVSPNTTETYRNVLVSNSLNVVHSLCQPEQIGALNPKFYTLNPKLLGWQQPAVGLACNR